MDHRAGDDDDDDEEVWIEADGNGLASDDDNEQEDDTVGCGGLFDDPDPYDEFHRTFSVAAGTKGSDDDGDDVSDVTVRLTGVKAENGQTLNSTGLTLWRASSLLCEFLASDPDHVRGKSVLELGAGLGLCGILAQKIGARRVMLTDGDTDTLQEMRNNVEANVKHTTTSDTTTTTIACRQLRWGRNLSVFKERWRRHTTMSHQSTHGDPAADDDGLFDVVMGSDIIYVEEILEPLFDTVSELLSATSPDAKFLLAYARRNVCIDLVFDCAQRHGFRWTEPEHSEGVFIFTRCCSN